MFPGRVYIGVSKNSRLPIYASIFKGGVVYHRAIQVESTWNFFVTEMGFFEISHEVLHCLQTHYGKIDGQSMYEYVAESVN